MIQCYYSIYTCFCIARTAVSFCGVILNNRESRRIYFSASASIFLTAGLEDGN